MIRKTIAYPWMKHYHLNEELELERIKIRLWKVIGEFSIHIDRTNEAITIPDGFNTNLASIPRLLYTIFPRSSDYDLAAAVHDYLYETGKYPRKVCDKIFKDFLILSNVSDKVASRMYRAVRVFGKNHYKGD